MGACFKPFEEGKGYYFGVWTSGYASDMGTYFKPFEEGKGKYFGVWTSWYASDMGACFKPFDESWVSSITGFIFVFLGEQTLFFIVEQTTG